MDKIRKNDEVIVLAGKDKASPSKAIEHSAPVPPRGVRPQAPWPVAARPGLVLAPEAGGEGGRGPPVLRGLGQDAARLDHPRCDPLASLLGALLDACERRAGHDAAS